MSVRARQASRLSFVASAISTPTAYDLAAGRGGLRHELLLFLRRQPEYPNFEIWVEVSCCPSPCALQRDDRHL